MAARLQAIFKSLDLKYLSSNDWSQVDKQTRKSKEGRIVGRIDGVEARICPEGHLLAGSYGLFATKKYDPFDVIGEYCGVITRKNTAYCADLHGIYTDDCWGVDSEKSGNELRFMNDHRNIADSPNVNMRRCFIDTQPRVLVVCLRTIEIGDEILTHYGDGFYDLYITNKGVDVKPGMEKTATETAPTVAESSSSSSLSSPDVADVADDDMKKATIAMAVTGITADAVQPIPIRGAGSVLVSNALVPDTVYSHCETITNAAAVLPPSVDAPLQGPEVVSTVESVGVIV